jgi:hypothetical protein
VVDQAFHAITYTFSKSIDPASVTAADFRMIGPNGQPVTPAALQMRLHDTVVEVSYAGTLAAGQYQAQLDASVADTAGVPLGSEVDTDFAVVQTIHWTQSAGGNWIDAPNWSSNSVPSASDEAVIDATGFYTVSALSPISAASIIVGVTDATLQLNTPGGSDSIGGDLSNSGSLLIDTDSGQGGTTLSVGGTLTNSNVIAIGNVNLSASTTVSAAALVNSGSISVTGKGVNQAALEIAGAAPGTLAGFVDLTGNALLQFSSGSITAIGGGERLSLSGAQAQVNDAGAPGNDSALTQLNTNAGTFVFEGSSYTL